ncbi:MAG: ABC transporter substrate-binding protein [Bacillota bacterium]
MLLSSRLQRSLGLLLSLSLLLVVVGCGTQSTPAPAAGQGEAKTAPAPQAEPAKRSIKHALGNTELVGTPKRVVALEWTYTEDLLALGIQPVGSADIKNYKKWVNVTPALAADVVDVGTRQEPNLETIASLKPDLIIGVKFRHEKIYDQLRAIAPTLIFDPYPGENGPNQLQEMEETFLAIADAVGKKAEGEAVLKRMNEKFAKAAADLKAKGKGGAEFALAQAFSNQNTAQIRLFTENAMASQILTRIGLKNAHKDAKFQVYGFSTVSVEALPAVQQAHFLYVVQESDDVFANQLKENPVWKGLAFVKEGRTYSLGGSTWLFGGPLSAELFVDKAVAALTR